MALRAFSGYMVAHRRSRRLKFEIQHVTHRFLYHLFISIGRRPNGFLGLSLNDRTIIFLVILLYKTVSRIRQSLH